MNHLKPIPNAVSHFAVQADDVPRAMKFYEKVFGWRFVPWGPPGFYCIETGLPENPGILGALHQRHEPVAGRGMIGFECSIAVTDVEAVAERVKRHGGVIVIPKCAIPTVGWMIKFHDSEGNVVGAMQYDASAA